MGNNDANLLIQAFEGAIEVVKDPVNEDRKLKEMNIDELTDKLMLLAKMDVFATALGQVYGCYLEKIDPKGLTKLINGDKPEKPVFGDCDDEDTSQPF